MGRSYATGTFNTIRIALRREMVLAMMRLWDKDHRALSLPKIADILGNNEVVEVLALECEQKWGHAPPIEFEEKKDPAILEIIQEIEKQFGRDESVRLRDNVKVVIIAIRDYELGGSKYEAVKRLKDIRNEHLAHRQIKQSKPVILKGDDPAVERFYEDMVNVVHLLSSAVNGNDYRPEETMAIHRKHAELFWAGVRGERTEGHPAFKALK